MRQHTWDITPLIKNCKKVVDACKISDGAYALCTEGENAGKLSRYGCADAANILYTIGEFPRDTEERKLWVETLQNMQEKETGLYRETHVPFHTTAHCIAALELFDASPRYKLTDMEQYQSKEGLWNWLDILLQGKPVQASHAGAGIYAALNIAGEASKEWNEWYFEWFWKETDPETGFWRKGYAVKENPDLRSHMVATFHYLFNHEHARMPLRYPEKVIDTCLELYQEKRLWDDFGRNVRFVEMDWVYCITRSLRQCGHRYEECVKTIREFADVNLDYMLHVAPDTNPRFYDLHTLFGALCCVAELQQFLPGYIYSDKPLKLVLDRRPFI